MLNEFKSWLMFEEVFPNKTATVYHRTKSLEGIQGILSSGFKQTAASSFTGNCLYGCGLYTTFDINSQFSDYMNVYGDYLIKFKATNLENYLIAQKNIATYVLGKNYKISDQLKRLTKKEFAKNYLDQLDEEQEKAQYSSDMIKEFYDRNKWIEGEIQGLIYRGRNDGYCLLKYHPINKTVSMIAYSYAPVNSSLSDIKWITSSSKMRIRDIYQMEPSDKRKDQSVLDVSGYTEDELMYAVKNKMYSYITNFLKKIRDNTSERASYALLLIRGSDTGGPESIEAKKKMIDLILRYKKRFSAKDVKDLLTNSMCDTFPCLVATQDGLKFFISVVERLGKNLNSFDFKEVDEFLIYLENNEKIMFIKNVLRFKEDIEDSEIPIILDRLSEDDEKEITELLTSKIGVTKLLRNVFRMMERNESDQNNKFIKIIDNILNSPEALEDKEYYLDYIKDYTNSKFGGPGYDKITNYLKKQSHEYERV
jgi:hypothetical protein